MCGIAGKINPNANEAEMLKALKTLRHRGPEGEGVYNAKPLVLGHTRLAIQDLSNNAAQPMLSDNDSYAIVYNGEIYNHQEIRSELLHLGIEFKSNSDTETLLQGYIHFGEKILERLNGIFSFAIFDAQKRELFAARDAFGVKPFYYFKDEQQFVFASEIKTISTLSGTQKSININAHFQTLMLQWVMDEHTGFNEIKKLLPGHFLNIKIDDLTQFHIEKWYVEPSNGRYKNLPEEEWIAQLDKVLTESVERQLLSDVPIGFFLSGGLDSSLLMAIAKKIDPEKTRIAFCLDAGTAFKNEGFSEDVLYAQKVAKHLNIELEIIKANSNFLQEFDQMIFHLEEAQGDIAPLFVQQISKSAREKGFKVLIGGVGGDDVFSGYRRHQAISKEQSISNTPLFLRKILKQLLTTLPIVKNKRRLQKLVENIDQSSRERMFSYFFWSGKKSVLNLFSKDLSKGINALQIEEYFEKYIAEIPEEKSLLNQMLHLEQKSFLPCHNLNYTDKMGMASSVEIRVPYLDDALVKLVASMPPELKMKGITTKYLLKKVAEKYLPKEVIYRSKTGFGAPIRSWMQSDKEFQQQVWQRLSSEHLSKSNIFDIKPIEQMYQDTICQKKDHSYTLLALLAIESWMRQFAPAN